MLNIICSRIAEIYCQISLCICVPLISFYNCSNQIAHQRMEVCNRNGRTAAHSQLLQHRNAAAASQSSAATATLGATAPIINAPVAAAAPQNVAPTISQVPQLQQAEITHLLNQYGAATAAAAVASTQSCNLPFVYQPLTVYPYGNILYVFTLLLIYHMCNFHMHLLKN